MGYSARYHAASLAAVFLALAVGILVGVGFGSDLVTGTAEDLERSLASDLDEARAKADELEAEIDVEREFGRAVYPSVVAGALRTQRVAVVGLGGLDRDTALDIEEAVGPAGAEVSEVAVVREPPDLEALAATRGGRRARALSRGDEAELQRLGERAGRALAGGGGGIGELRGTLLSRYSGTPVGIDGVVVVRDRPPELEPEQELTTDVLEESLVAGMRANAETVGAERTDTDPSSIEFFEANGIASVDNVNLNAGRVALVYALGGAAGKFGVKDSADSLLPDLLQPVSGDRVAGGPRG